MKQHDIIKKVNDILKDVQNISFATITPDGYPHVATRTFCKPTNILGGYISTNTSGNLAQSITKNNKASICASVGDDNITLVGTAKIVYDKKIKEKLWIDWFINHYTQGIDDPEYCIIEFTTERVSLWVDREIAKFNIDSFINPVSYCGLLCTTCDFVKSNNCNGCIATKGNPFYGECKIAKCCLEKELAHCGQCDKMPCDMLKEYSCGDGEHCDKPKGSRLEVLEMWK